MKIAVTCCNLNLALELVDKKVENIIVGLKGFSCRFNNYLDFEEIKILVENKQNSLITVCLNNLYFEESINELEKIIKQLVDLKIDTIMFADFAIPCIIKENNYNVNLHYHPETIVTNYGQFDFYLKNKINSVSLASELTMTELNKIHENKDEMQTYIKIYGLGFIMHSRWPMISNFQEHLGCKTKIVSKYFNSINYLLIKEETRKYPNILYEDFTGTHMLTGYYLCGIKKINEFKKMDVDFILIDALFIHDSELHQIVDKFIDARNLNYGEEQLIKYHDEIQDGADFLISEGFFGTINDRLHMLKEDANE